MTEKMQVGILGFGKAGRLVANEFIEAEDFHVNWVLRRSKDNLGKFASRLLGHEHEEGKLRSLQELREGLLEENPVNLVVDFSNSDGIYDYRFLVERKVPLVTAISSYKEDEKEFLMQYSKEIPILYSPNITLGINFLMVAAQVLQKIAPHADIEIVEEHFKAKEEISGTAKRIARVLGLNDDEHINSVRVGGIVGRHEIIFGLPHQTIRLSHESISRSAFGQGAIFAARFLLKQLPGMYSMENIVADMFRQNTPVY